jgi:hypothetical protein
VLTISGPGGSVLGQFAADAQDAEILARRVHAMSAGRYGQVFTEDLECLGCRPGWVGL